MASGNIPGVPNALPGVFDVIETQSTGTAVPGGGRIAAMIGEGSTSETIISAALGGGVDGLNPSYTSANGADGRHFTLSLAPIISNRTQLFRNGFPLVGLESLIDSNPFSNVYDYRVDIATGHIELQTAHLVDQGGLNYKASTTNVGDGYILTLALTDLNAPSENWTIKCISVQRDSSNLPIQKTAKFIASGSVSGNLLDANGNQVVWVANGQTVTNGILSFKIFEKQLSGNSTSPFREGDSFVIKVNSGVLTRNDSLTASYIPAENINDPELLQTVSDVQRKHGIASIDNNLALGCQLAFANGAPAILTVQAAPAIPRRTSYEMDPAGVDATSTDPNDFIFPFPAGVTPDLNSQIHVFVLNKTTNVETQLLPNKFAYYTLGTGGQPTVSAFVLDDVSPPGGNSFSYSVIKQADAIISGFDGYITGVTGSPLDGVFESPSVVFTASYVGKVVEMFDALNVANNGYFLVTGVVNGNLQVEACDANGSPLSNYSDFSNQSSISFQVIDPTTGLPVASGTGTDGYITKIANTGTATFGSSATVNFAGLGTVTNFLLKINGTTANNGLYLITANSAGPNTITIAKTTTTESNIRFEVLDLDATSDYLVLNHNVVPNGNALRVTIVDSRDASFYDAGWSNALTALESQEIDILVTLPKSTISVIFQNALNHCLTMSSTANRKERVFFTGAISGLTPANLTGAKLAAVEQLGVFEGIPNNDIPTLLAGEMSDIANYSVSDAFGNTYRCVYFYPDQIVVQAGGQNVLMDGFYLAAAAAGYLSGVGNVAIPLTNKTLTGFTILRSKQYSPLILSQLASSGVTTLQPVQGGGRVVWGLTTTQSGFVEEQEISIVFIRDKVAKNLRAGFLGYIGIAEDGSTLATLSARAIALLKSFIAQGLITAYDSLLVTRDAVDPTQWNITVRVQPTYPVNFIFIKVSLGLL